MLQVLASASTQRVSIHIKDCDKHTECTGLLSLNSNPCLLSLVVYIAKVK